MKIVAAGDSFIYGSELSDCDIVIDNQGPIIKHSKKTFFALLGADYDYVCLAKPGIANDSISRRVIEFCETQQNDIFVLVSWTFPGRYEFRFNYDTKQKDSPWLSLTPWLVNSHDAFSNATVAAGDDTMFQHRQAVYRAKVTGTLDFGKVFYSHVGNSEYWEIYSSLKEIVYLQNYLTVNKIPYLFTCADNSILYNYTISNPNSTITSLLNQVLRNSNNWFWFPASNIAGETQKPRGFYQWAVENKYPIGTTHPLEEAHYAAFQLIKGKFNELVKEHI